MQQTPDTRRLWLLALLYAFVLLLPTAFLPLMETTEARYAEIAREMVASGNWLEPHFNGIKHFHKPPLPYWLIAAGLQLFGVNDFGARFFGVVSAVLALFFFQRLARVVAGEERTVWRATLIFSSSLLFLAVSRIVSTDIHLTCCTVAVLYYLLRRRSGERHRRDPLLLGLWLGLGFLVKGPVIFLFTLVPLLVAKCFDPGHRRLFNWGEVALGLLVFAAVALPWYLAVTARNPGLLDYFLKVQTVERVTTDRFHRSEPPWYFLTVFAAGFFPWVLFFGRGLASLRRLAPQARVMLVYVALPFALFTLNQSKQATYILPLFPAASLFTAEVMGALAMPRLRNLAVALLALLAAAVGSIGFAYQPLRAYWPLFVVAAALAGVVVWIAARSRKEERFVDWTAVTLILVFTAAHGGMALAGPELKSYEAMVSAIDRRDPERQREVMVYLGFLPSISFYRGKLAVAALGGARETQFQYDDSYRRHYLGSEEEVRAFLAGEPELFVVAKPDNFEHFRRSYPDFSCELVFSQRKHAAYLCLQPTSAADVPAPAEPKP